MDLELIGFWRAFGSSCCHNNVLNFVYPTAVKCSWGIVFTHGVGMGGQVVGWREKVCLGCISETVRCRKLILGTDIGQGV